MQFRPAESICPNFFESKSNPTTEIDLCEQLLLDADDTWPLGNSFGNLELPKWEAFCTFFGA
jgi:hypothetical protein